MIPTTQSVRTDKKPGQPISDSICDGVAGVALFWSNGRMIIGRSRGNHVTDWHVLTKSNGSVTANMAKFSLQLSLLDTSAVLFGLD